MTQSAKLANPFKDHLFCTLSNSNVNQIITEKGVLGGGREGGRKEIKMEGLGYILL